MSKVQREYGETVEIHVYIQFSKLQFHRGWISRLAPFICPRKPFLTAVINIVLAMFTGINAVNQGSMLIQRKLHQVNVPMGKPESEQNHPERNFRPSWALCARRPSNEGPCGRHRSNLRGGRRSVRGGGASSVLFHSSRFNRTSPRQQ